MAQQPQVPAIGLRTHIVGAGIRGRIREVWVEGNGAVQQAGLRVPVQEFLETDEGLVLRDGVGIHYLGEGFGPQGQGGPVLRPIGLLQQRQEFAVLPFARDGAFFFVRVIIGLADDHV